MYTLAQLKKMNTERLHKVFQKLAGYALFNPFVERTLMITVIMSKQNPMVEQRQTSIDVLSLIDKTCQIIGKVFAATIVEPIKPAPSTKGRKPRFSYDDITTMFLMYDNGYSVKDISEYFETSYMIVYQIVVAHSAYTWVWDGSITLVDMFNRKVSEIANQFSIPFKLAHKFYEGS